ncbi:cell division protein FtsK [Parvibaculum sedimenti]|uniref:DNA translocase FtsK n=1 Tax=Parvibaculum sedimenti TaxID=2608632 RepID=A0A6N6VNV4_9HYPH|nr:DNA translocase FtsK [Parvibaculum sedimenti]KAB7742332.1 cell division protein FtsK [Parvibaculum sedimenti]
MRVRSLNPLAFLPMGARVFLARRFEELAGAALVMLGLFGFLALVSWSRHDPSLNNATGLPPQNWMGMPGAYISDILLQTLGLGALALLAPPIAWGIRLARHNMPQRLVLRVAAWLLATLFAAAFLGTLPLLAIWALAPGLGFGGVLGDALSALGLQLLAPFIGNGMSYALTAFVTAPIAGFLALYAADVEWNEIIALANRSAFWRRDEEEEEEEEQLAYPVRRRPRGGEIETPAPRARGKRPYRPDVEPSRLRVMAWTIGDAFTDLRDRLMREGEYAPLSADEIEAARAAGFKARRARKPEPDDEYEDEDEIDVDFDDELEDEDDVPSILKRGRIEPKLDGKAAPRVSRSAPKPKPSKRAVREAQPALPLEPVSNYQLPPLSLLAKPKPTGNTTLMTDEALQQNARLLESVLDDFGIRGEIINVHPGPVVTLYELEPAPGIKSSRVIALADDIARSMSAVSARVAVVPGRNAIGIELPNHKREMVFLRELLETPDYENSNSKLTLALGKNIGGEAVVSDLARMPHLLIAGTTGSGKSVGINTMILSLLYRLSPEQCKLIMIDPKMLELSVYDGIPHLLAPVVTDPKKAVVALKWVVKEMEDRYRKMSKVGVRNIDGYNTRVIDADAKGEVLVRTVQTGFDKETGKAIYEEEEMDLSPMPFIVVIVDEMADLMMVAGKEIEGAIQRLAQMARAAGIHIITATQRPSVDVITGTIKANFPTRISFQVTSKIDSRTILGEQGAEQLLGQGDMLYMAGGGRIRRVHGPFVSDEEVEKVVTFLKKQGVPEYLEAITAEPEENGEMFGLDGEGSGDDLYDKAVAIVARDKRASTSYIQRRLQIGYNRAARLIELMEEQGVVSAPNHQGKREVLVGDH